MKRSTAAVAAAVVLLCAGGVHADSLFPEDEFPGEFSANVALGTEYIFRGISQTDEEPTIQGGFDYGVGIADTVDFYVGSWASNVDFNDGDEAHIEIDYYGGFTGGFAAIPGLSWDIGSLYYSYPGAADELDYDYVEGYVGLGYDFGVASLSVAANLSPEFFGDSGDAQYYALDAEVPLPKGLTLALHGARQEIDENETFGTPDYWDWKVALVVPVLGFDLEFAYIDTDLTETECFGGSELCEARFVFVGSRSF